jgi:long-chain acyl-CoA synthetase
MPQLASDRRLNILPFSHAYARTCELSTWIISGSSMMTVSTIDKMLEVAPRFQPTLVNGVPYLFEIIQQRVLKSKTMHRSSECAGSETEKQLLHEVLGTQLRMLAAGGAGLDEATFTWFASCGYPIYQGYGLTEASPVVCSNRYPNPSSKHVGFPVLNTEVRIDANQRLHVRGPGVMVGYDDDEEATKDRIRDGWLDTGDLAEWTADGAVRILGRGDDRITLPTGYKIDPAPVERKLCKVLSVDHCMLLLSSNDRLLLIVPSNLPNSEPMALATGDRAIISVPISPEASAYGSGRTIPNPSKQSDFASNQTSDELLRSLRTAIPDEPHYALPTELMIVANDWSQATGMLNAKGAIQRTRIRDRYLGGIK